MSRLKIFNYHNVDVAPSCARLQKLYVDPHQFERQCHALQRLGLRGVTLSEGLAALARGNAHRCIALTFDDGFADNVVHAAPILKQFGFRATCYVVSGHIGAYNAWDANEVGVKKPLMSGAQLQQWLADGNEIGSHTVSHPHLHLLNRSAAEEEIVASRESLARLVGVPIEHFCYPYGQYSEETRQIVRIAGYASAVTTHRGAATAASDPWRLPRISINGDKGLLKFALKAATPYASFGISARRRAA